MGSDDRRGSWAEALLSFVQRYPGVHFREIRRRLGIPIGTLDYHLYRMEKEGLVSVTATGGYKCVYPAVVPELGGPIPELDRRMLALLRQSVPRSILLHLYLEGPSSTVGLARDLGTTAQNLAYFLQRLEGAGAIVREGVPGSRTARLADPKRVHALLLQFPPLPEDPIDRFLRFWTELHP